MTTVTFQKKEEKQKYLGLIALVVIFLIFMVIRYGFSKKGGETRPSVPSQPIAYSLEAVEINFDIFKNSFFEHALPFERIKPFEGRIGRENPFVPYPAVLPSFVTTTSATSTSIPASSPAASASTPAGSASSSVTVPASPAF